MPEVVRDSTACMVGGKELLKVSVLPSHPLTMDSAINHGFSHLTQAYAFSVVTPTLVSTVRPGEVYDVCRRIECMLRARVRVRVSSRRAGSDASLYDIRT
jgi:hypothetical protein